MKVIDILNKIANGEEVPKKIKYKNNILYYDDDTKEYPPTFNYYDEKGNNALIEGRLCQYINDEVEIIEENKKISKIHKIVPCENYIIADKSRKIEDRLEIIRKRLYADELYMLDISNSINEIIDYLEENK